MFNYPYTMRVIRSEDFRGIRNSRVLLYFPHGFGDAVFLSYMLPFMEPSNKYWFTRFGDAFTALFEGNDYITPLYMGSQVGGDEGNWNFSIANINKRTQYVNLPYSLQKACQDNEIDTLLWVNFHEPLGNSAFPFHSKMRRNLFDLRCDEDMDFNYPLLESTVNFVVDSYVDRWVRARLMSQTGWGEHKRLCLIARNGHSCTEKNWGHLWREERPEGRRQEGDECRDFMRLMLLSDPDWVFLVMEDHFYEGEHTLRDGSLNCYSYAELFGEMSAVNMPLGLVAKVLVNVADVCVGVDTGPYHLAVAKPGLPTVGIWLHHFPSWYDDPRPGMRHVLSYRLRGEDIRGREGTFEEKGCLKYNYQWVETHTIGGQDVMNAVQAVLPPRKIRTREAPVPLDIISFLPEGQAITLFKDGLQCGTMSDFGGEHIGTSLRYLSNVDVVIHPLTTKVQHLDTNWKKVWINGYGPGWITGD